MKKLTQEIREPGQYEVASSAVLVIISSGPGVTDLELPPLGTSFGRALAAKRANDNTSPTIVHRISPWPDDPLTVDGEKREFVELAPGEIALFVAAMKKWRAEVLVV